MTAYLSKIGACPNVRLYMTDASRDYLITDRIIGRDAASSEYLAEPSRLCDIFADSLSYFHRLPDTDCPSRTDWRKWSAGRRRITGAARRS